jgi:hypothetical protein
MSQQKTLQELATLQKLETLQQQETLDQTEQQPQNLSERIDSLERRCRLLTRVAYTCLASLVVCLFGGAYVAESFEEVKTEKLEIVDSNGKVRVRLGKADEGYGIVIYDSAGRYRATLTDAPLGAGMQLIKDGGTVNMFAYQNASGLTVRDGKGKPRAVVAVTKDGSTLQLLDENGQPEFSAPIGN